MKRKLSSIQQIESLKSIPKADFIVKASLKNLKWAFVVKKGEFKEGDLCVYFEIDSILPKTSWTKFLEKNIMNKDGILTKTWDTWIRTQIFRGQISQGLALPINILPIKNYKIGMDVTDLLKVTKKPDIIREDNSLVKGPRPFFIQRTKEFRIESKPEILLKFKGILIYITEKLNGESVTYAKNENIFYICSRRGEIKQDRKSKYTIIEQKYNIESILRAIPDNIALQGELIGPNICKNQYQLSEFDFYIFNIYDIDTQQYWEIPEVIEFIKKNNLALVPIIFYKIPLINDFDSIKKLARGISRISKPSKNIMREGIVIRPMKEIIDEEIGRISFKIVDPKQLIKYNKS